MKQTQNQYYGKRKDMPNKLHPGSIYICSDENSLYHAREDGVLINLNDSTSGKVFTDVTGEPSGALTIGGNIVRISQANYDAAETATTLIANTLYIIDESL